MKSHILRNTSSPHWCGSIGWASYHKVKGLQFDSWSGHMYGLQVWTLFWVCVRGNWSMFLSFSFSLLSPLIKKKKQALACVAQWFECWTVKQRVTGLILSQGHACVVDWVPSRRHARGNHTLMFLPLSSSLPSPLSKNK